jgi:diguanylate cyclase (GGDEF)-like protein/PAS domain S-box-containing protein
MRRGRLIIVEDDRSSRDAMCRLLERYGYEIVGAEDGPQALELIGRAACDLILLDVELPGVNGLEVLTRIRSRTPQVALPVIMVTGRTDGADIVEAFERGANDYVTKPIDVPIALARIGTHVAHKWAVERVRESEERYALAVRGANDGLWDWNLVTKEVYWSPRWKEMVGCGADEVSTDPGEWLRRVHPEDVEAVRRGLDAHLASGAGYYESEHRLQHRDGGYRWVLCRGAAVRSEAGVATRLAGSFTDITGGKLADRVTGLPNRLLFVDLLQRAIVRTRRRREYRFGVLVFGLDRFTALTDSLGRDTANRLLTAVATRLQSDGCAEATAHGDRPATLARLGEDEFAVLLDDLEDPGEAIRASERLRATLERPFELDGQRVFVSPRVGIAIGSWRYRDSEEVLRDATIALNRARAEGGTWCELFDPDMRRRVVTRLQMESDLRQAIENESFQLHYQPIVALGSGRIKGFEALVRWPHPQRGLLCPTEFIGVAEDTGMIRQLGSLVVAEACRQMARWQGRLGGAAPEIVSVNVSSLQFADPNFPSDLQDILVSSGLDPRHLKLEITESALMGDVPAARELLTRIRSMGIQFSLDDFGTGYSSLSYLHELPIDTLKIDQSFVSRIGSEKDGAVMARAIVALAQSLGMDVVAEGVETQAQFTKLQLLGCEYAQGYFFSRPVEKREAGRLVRAQPWAASDDRTEPDAARRSVA